jgi:hypothetical protein
MWENILPTGDGQMLFSSAKRISIQLKMVVNAELRRQGEAVGYLLSARVRYFEYCVGHRNLRKVERIEHIGNVYSRGMNRQIQGMRWLCFILRESCPAGMALPKINRSLITIPSDLSAVRLRSHV